MGWLRDLMLDAEIPSFGVLARAALTRAEWPEQSKAQPRSLAAMFSRFDRGLELDWLSDRPAVQQVLSEVLKCQLADLRAPLQRAEQDQTSPARMRLEGLPAARSLEFAEEPLPPGLPPDVSIPASWERLIWLAPPGAGRTIARQWLDVRGRSMVCSVRTSGELQAVATFGPPLFIDARKELLDAKPGEWGPSRPVCLAIDSSASAIRPWLDAGWRLATCAPISESLNSIVMWLASRLNPQAHFEAEAVAAWLREGPLAEGLLETLGDVLGWCGLVTSMGLEATRRRDKKQILSLVVRRALAPLAEKRDARSSGLSRKVPELLVAMAERSLLLQDDWLTSRTLEGWVELLPDQDRLGPDVDWMRVHLAAASKAIRARDVERAAQRFPPGAHRWMGLLRDAGLIRPIDAERFVMRPHFLARLVLSNAKSELIQTSSAVWGDALLEGEAAVSVWPELQKRAETSPELLIDAVLEDLDEESPSSVVALDATVVVMGLRVLGGHELAPALAEPLLDEACALALQRMDELPRPRISLGSPTKGLEANVLWWLCLIALGETLAAKRRKVDARLIPWLQREPPAQLLQLFDSLHHQFSALPRPLPAWVLGTFSLLERLRQSLGAVQANGKPHVLHAPGIVLDEVLHGVLEFATLSPLLEQDLLFEAFDALAKQRKCSEATWAESFWLAMAAADFGVTARGFLSRHLQRMAAHIPTDIGLSWLQGEPPIEGLVPLLPVSVMRVWLNQREAGSGTISLELARVLPEELVEHLLIELEPKDEAILPILWQRFPERVLSRIHRFRVMMPDKAARWLEKAPLETASVLFKGAELDEWIKASAPVLLALRRYSQCCIDARVEEWQLAYGWLVRVERVLRGSG